jgi:ribosomal protein S18 acetylase RimI-like enzyme
VHVRSLGYRTDLIFSAFNGEVIDRGDHLVIRTPSNPNFYWGNFLLFGDPPGAGDFVRWRTLFSREIGSPPAVKHETYGWDTTRGDLGLVQPFLEDGFQLSRSTVLTTGRLDPPRQADLEIVIKPLRTERDWHEAVENQIRCREPGHDVMEYRKFKVPQMAAYRSMANAGKGEWFGAFAGDELVADLGLFHDDGLARYQSVGTHPDYRRHGIASNLVYQAGLYAFEHHAIDALVIVADEGSAASRLYRSLGFDPREEQFGLERFPHAVEA